ETQMPGLAQPERLMGAFAPLLEQVPDNQGAVAAHALAMQMVRLGQWELAREVFLQMIERYPAHPLTADAYRWLIRHNSSSETRRRHELGQFLVWDLNLPTGGRAVQQEIHLPEPQKKPKKDQKPGTYRDTTF